MARPAMLICVSGNRSRQQDARSLFAEQADLRTELAVASAGRGHSASSRLEQECDDVGPDEEFRDARCGQQQAVRCFFAHRCGEPAEEHVCGKDASA